MRKRIIKIQCDKCIFSKVPLLSYWWSAPHQHAWPEALGGLSQLAALLCQVFEQCLDGRGVMWLVIVVRKCDNIVILIITHQVNPSTHCSSSLPKTISLKSPFPPLFFFIFIQSSLGSQKIWGEDTEFSYIPCPSKNAPIINIPHQSGKFIIIEEPILIRP